MVIVGGALLIGLAAGTLGYLGSSLVIGPEVRAGTDELRERGARIYFESCAGFSVEPRFWPECVGDAPDKRIRGAEALVAFCTGADRYNRFFGPNNCLADNRPPLALTATPEVEDIGLGAIAAAVALAALAVMTLLTRAPLEARRPAAGHPGSGGEGGPDGSDGRRAEDNPASG
jgi:hypothetical protein